jgi:hypothetical protein
MGNKIIIDEEVLAKLDAEMGEARKNYDIRRAYVLNDIRKFILENSTTISIDDSIEERAKKYAGIKPTTTVDEEERYYNPNIQHYDGYKQGATEQSIISEIKSKECYSLRDMADCWREAQEVGGGKKQMTQPFKRFIDSLIQKQK